MSWLSAYMTLGYRAVTKSGYASCIPPERGGHFLAVGLDCKGLDQWRGIAYTCVVIVSA